MTNDIITLLVVLLVTVVLFVTELLRVDVIAILAMITVAWLGLVTPAEAFSGFSSTAVISIIGVMIIGYSVEKSGLMRKVSNLITKTAHQNENKLLSISFLSAGGVSAFFPNMGVAALFLPTIRRIARETKIPSSRLLMPMGFAAMLGGTITMVGSGPMIIVNDLLDHAKLPPFNLFGSTPVGLALLLAGAVFFLLVGKRLLPFRKRKDKRQNRQQQLIERFHLETSVSLFHIPENSPLVGKTREEAFFWKKYRLHLLALTEGKDITYAPWRKTRFQAGQELAVSGCREETERFIKDYKLQACASTEHFKCIMDTATAGFAEAIVMPDASIVGKTFREIAFRKNFDVEPVMIIRGNTEKRGNFGDFEFKPGDILIVYGVWEKILALKKSDDFTVPTPFEMKPTVKSRVRCAAVGLLAILAGVIAGVNLPLVLMSGALFMILVRIISIEEAYRAVDWRTVFLIAGLIPLGTAMEKTGAAMYFSKQIMTLLEHSPQIIILLVIGVLATVLSLFMSNVAATVLLVPLAINIADSAGINPCAAALLVAICASNSFVIPTNQVNAFLMSPGGYRTRDFIKVGGIMTVIFLAVAVSMVYWIFI